MCLGVIADIHPPKWSPTSLGSYKLIVGCELEGSATAESWGDSRVSEEDFHTSNTLIWTTEDRMSLHLLRNVTKTEIYSSDMTKKKKKIVQLKVQYVVLGGEFKTKTNWINKFASFSWLSFTLRRCGGPCHLSVCWGTAHSVMELKKKHTFLSFLYYYLIHILDLLNFCSKK